MNKYFKKYGFQPLKITSSVPDDLFLSIVIPCFNEQSLIFTLDSLKKCAQPTHKVEVIVVINQEEHVSKEIASRNQLSYDECLAWSREEAPFFDTHLLFEQALPKKHAGVGLARKIGMDEAAMRFETINKDGVIVCLDADCLVKENYLVELEKHFINHPKTPGCAIRYEHPLTGNDYQIDNYQGIINYELFLRYYNLATKYAGLPYAYHTVGSSMAVKSSAYQKQGGMNKRKAGEDFYFLHKIIALGNFTELNSTVVYPSPRTSDRVPFGTGKAINDFINQDNKEAYLTYDFRSFEVLKAFLDKKINTYLINSCNIFNEVILQFLKTIDFDANVEEIKRNTSSYPAFEKRFFHFFDAFKILKYVHHTRDNFYPNTEIKEEVFKLLEVMNVTFDNTYSKKELLLLLRKIEANEMD